ncbi:MAG: molybdenum cofactor biosynthesis protein B [Stenotrophobium sp.]
MSTPPVSLRICVLTISDTRTMANDASGRVLAERLGKAGHVLHAREIVRDDIYAIRAVVSKWIFEREPEVILTTGGTGVTGRDGTPEAIAPLLDKRLDGFGELFRMRSYARIGASTIQSRCLAGVANGKYLFCVPGSQDACETAWDEILAAQLDSRVQPCNFAQILSRLRE